MNSEEGFLCLSNGLRIKGHSLGSENIGAGELVFTTAMVGYAQALTDPSYFGQILVFTYPLIGNYGVPSSNDLLDGVVGLESASIKVAGVIMSNESAKTYHWSSSQTLRDWLNKNSTPALSGVDTRFLTQVIREEQIVLAAMGPNKLFNMWDGRFTNPNERNILPEVSIKSRKVFGRSAKKVAVIDCGVKWGIIRELLRLGCEVEVLPWDTDFKTVKADGWVISNGPGDPQKTGDLISRLSCILSGEKPVLGICLGFQLMALAVGARTQKMKFGHRGHNQPVNLLHTNRGYITSQNHGYEVIKDSLPSDWEPWFINVNDNSLEGIKNKFNPYRGVQFHPEAAAGPQDTFWIIQEFVCSLTSTSTR